MTMTNYKGSKKVIIRKYKQYQYYGNTNQKTQVSTTRTTVLQSVRCWGGISCPINDLIRFDFWCFDATFSNSSAISWQPVLVVEEAGVPGENHQPCP